MKKINSCEIICVGTELLLGEIINTNAAFLSLKLAELGIGVYHQCVVGDNPKRLAEAYKTAIERSDLIIFSGGLGPTYDDLTKETVAQVLGLELTLNEEALERIELFFKKTGHKMTDNNIKQAFIPWGAYAIQNDYGTAPGIIIEHNDKATVMLPGPPNELEPMFAVNVIPYINKYCDSTIVSHNINIMGIGESAVEKILKDIMLNSENPTVAPYAKCGEVRLRITAKAQNRDAAEVLCCEMIEKLKKTSIGNYIYGIDENSVEEAVIKFLKKNKLTAATAESCTGGLIAKRLTDIPGSSEVFVSGIVSYSNTIKSKVLGVSDTTIERFTEISTEAASEMAESARKLFCSDIGVSTTGFTGPTGGNEKDPIGTVYVAVSTAHGVHCERMSYSAMRDRKYIREAAASRAMLLVLKYGLDDINKI